MRAKNTLISGEASAIVGFLRRHIGQSRLLVAVTIAGPVIAAAWAFLRGGRFGRWRSDGAF